MLYEAALTGLKPEQLLGSAYAAITAVFGGDFDHSILADIHMNGLDHIAVGMAPDPTTHEFGTTTTVEPAHHFEKLTHLRDDAVGTPQDEKSAIDDAYKGSTIDTPVETDPSKVMQAARAIADAEHLSPAKREAFLQYVQDNRADMHSATIENGKLIIMGDGPRGGFNAKTFEVDLPEENRDVITGSFTYTEDGVTKTETVYLFNDCANPAIDAAPDQIVPPTPPTPTQVVPPPTPAPVAPICTTDWSQTTEHSDKGIHFGHTTIHEVPVIHAPPGLSVEEATAKLQHDADIASPEQREQLLKSKSLLFAGVHCDGHVDRVECVTYKIENGHLVVCVTPLEYRGQPYDTMSPEAQDRWMKE